MKQRKRIRITPAHRVTRGHQNARLVAIKSLAEWASQAGPLMEKIAESMRMMGRAIVRAAESDMARTRRNFQHAFTQD